MDTILEVIILVIFKIPGAFIRWLLSGCRKPLKEFIDNGDAYLDGFIGLTVCVLIVVLIRFIFFNYLL